MVLVRAFAIFVILLVLALLLGQAGSVPVPVTVSVGSLQIATSAPVAITLIIAVLLLAFYAGRLVSWLISVPAILMNRRKRSAAEALADAYAACAIGDLNAASRALQGFKPDNQPHADLAAILALQSTPLPQNAVKQLDNPRLAAFAAQRFAHQAAVAGDWAEVRRVTAIGRGYAPENLPLLTMQFKALVNLNDRAATELLPTLKAPLGAERVRLLTLVLQGPDAISARPVLGSPWVRAFQAWLPTASDVFPSDEAA